MCNNSKDFGIACYLYSTVASVLFYAIFTRESPAYLVTCWVADDATHAGSWGSSPACAKGNRSADFVSQAVWL